jgi:hypothetical protein
LLQSWTRTLTIAREGKETVKRRLSVARTFSIDAEVSTTTKAKLIGFRP